MVAFDASQASAQVTIVERQDNKQPIVYKMTVSPAAEPQPALKYRFLVPPVDQIHANAATLYYKAMSFEGPDPLAALSKAMSDDQAWDEFFTGPLARFPQNQAAQLGQWLNGEYFEWIREAARCDYCDWADGIRQHGVATLLPQAQNSRTACRALAIRARLQITQQKFDGAVETLAAGYAWSRAWSHGTTLVQCLIGMGFQELLDQQTATFIAADDSPNLYWALTDLAVRPIELREALSYESKMWEFTIHDITQLNDASYHPKKRSNSPSRFQTSRTIVVFKMLHKYFCGLQLWSRKPENICSQMVTRQISSTPCRCYKWFCCTAGSNSKSYETIASSFWICPTTNFAARSLGATMQSERPPRVMKECHLRSYCLRSMQ